MKVSFTLFLIIIFSSIILIFNNFSFENSIDKKIVSSLNNLTIDNIKEVYRYNYTYPYSIQPIQMSFYQKRDLILAIKKFEIQGSVRLFLTHDVCYIKIFNDKYIDEIDLKSAKNEENKKIYFFSLKLKPIILNSRYIPNFNDKNMSYLDNDN